VTTGISTSDRSKNVALIDPTTEELGKPGAFSP
jgi:hypothetical protein